MPRRWRRSRSRPSTTPAARQTSRVSAVYQAAPRQSFVVALKDLPEIWEVVLQRPDPPTIFRPRPQLRAGHGGGGWRRRSASRSGGSSSAEPLDDFFFDPGYDTPDRLQPRRRQGGGRQSRRPAARSPSCRCPACRIWAPASAGSWQGRRVMATPHLKEAALSVVDTGRLAGDQAHPDARARLLHAQPRDQPLRLGRRLAGPREGQGAGPRQAHARDRARRSSPPRARPRPMSSSPATAASPCLSVWRDRRRARRLRRRHASRRSSGCRCAKPIGKYNVWNKISRSRRGPATERRRGCSCS